jgi:hypothetical protein
MEELLPLSSWRKPADTLVLVLEFVTESAEVKTALVILNCWNEENNLPQIKMDTAIFIKLRYGQGA